MNTTVRDIMNPKLVYLHAGDRPELARTPILDLGITAVPVLDDDHKPLGVVSLRDLADPRRKEALVTTPAEKIAVDASVHSAALALTDADVHHLVVVDVDGRAVGMISALDVLRAMLGLAVKHPKTIEAFH